MRIKLETQLIARVEVVADVERDVVLLISVTSGEQENMLPALAPIDLDMIEDEVRQWVEQHIVKEKS